MAPLHEALFAWYEANARPLPWRATRDPYALLVCEVMSQQTQIDRVVPHWETWLERWPTAAALADAGRGEVLAAWVGLGYNARALRLQSACRIIVEHGWPPDAAGLQGLPGVGPYTAAAVASFAFDEPIIAVDTNVRRVAARLGLESPQALLCAARPAASNQASMELGALVCKAREAACGRCPVAPFCPSCDRLVTTPRGRGAGPTERFEDSNRWVRGRIVEALAAGDGLPAEIDPERLRKALAGLERDGLVLRGPEGLSLG